MFRAIRAIVVTSSLLLLAGCQAQKDLSQECRMTRPGDGAPVDIEASSVPATPGVDYMALGAAECENLVCLRTSGSANPENADGKARGYCSAPCIEDKDCEPDYQGKKGTMKCDRVLPDQQFLDALRQSSPDTYEQTFGSGASARYCVRPRTAQ